jgi:hypothetical protein
MILELLKLITITLLMGILTTGCMGDNISSSIDKNNQQLENLQKTIDKFSEGLDKLDTFNLGNDITKLTIELKEIADTIKQLTPKQQQIYLNNMEPKIRKLIKKEIEYAN